ncbi:MAG: DUF2202 domain-containing protein [Spirochaetales bacterium]|nr:DUF2202 domain-containing protein [Spirochaetales bacterium]
MKHGTKIMIMVFIVIAITAGMLSGQGNEWGNNRGQTGTGNSISGYPVEDLSAREKAGLLQMYEEEKLARDVYNVLFVRWGLSVFSNIARSEQTHIDAIKQLLEKYDLPVDIQKPGEFSNQELAVLYDELTRKGEASIQDALMVGATIEDLDIFDLDRFIKESDNTDIKIVYNNLQKGSRNHLRSFYSQLQNYGITYSAMYISTGYLEKVISTGKERGGITDPEFVF